MRHLQQEVHGDRRQRLCRRREIRRADRKETFIRHCDQTRQQTRSLLFAADAAKLLGLFTYNGRAIQSFKIEEDDFNVFVYYDAQLYANELADAADRAEHKNEVKDGKVQRELSRREKDKCKLTDEQLIELQPQDLKQVLEATPEMETVSIRTNRLDLNSNQPTSNARLSNSPSERTATGWTLMPPT